MKAIKPPYNVNSLTQRYALEALNDVQGMQERVDFLIRERKRLAIALHELPVVNHIFPSVTNFLLVRFANGDEVYHYLLSKGIVVRNRSNQPNCKHCLRITIGTKAENDRLLQELRLLQ